MASIVFARSPMTAQQQPALRIVVIEGEDAVNVVHQQTAVAPVVEVRDRNDQPVAGAIVRFAIRSGRATFSGARTLAVTTDAAGRALATGFAPVGSGTLQIGVTAAFQGQTAAAVTIAQTTVMTAAQAAAVSSGAGAGVSSGGATAGAGTGAGGGGLSATTLGVVAGAVAGGTLVATQVLGKNPVRTFRGPVSWTLTMNATNTATGNLVCSLTDNYTGIFLLEMDESDGAITGTGAGRLSGTSTRLATTCGNPRGAEQFSEDGLPVSGTPGNLSINYQRTFMPAGAPGTTNTVQVTFSGAFESNSIVGSLTFADRDVSPNRLGVGSTTVQVRLQ